MNLVISPKRVTQILTSVVLCLTLASLAVLFLLFSPSHYGLIPVAGFFYLPHEANLPTWYASSTLLLSAFLLAIIAFAKKKEGTPFVIHWTALSFIFLCLSFDEAFEVHERWIKPLRAYFNASGFFDSAWVIPGIAFVLIFALVYLRFLMGLPVKFRRLFLIAGALFVGGAIGVEMVGEYFGTYYGRYNILHSLIATVEEL